MKRRRLVRALLISTAWVALGCDRAPGNARARFGARRLVSLSPGITETLFAIGAGDELVGVSDYCNYPEAANHLPRTGTALTPNYEAIVRLAPTLILCDAALSVPRRELTALGISRFLPWLSLEEIVASTRLLGALTDHALSAGQLAARLWDGLAVAEAMHGPRVLLVLGESAGRLSEIYFVKQNSIHGAALRAAGARNAVAKDVDGVPRLSIEGLIALDPDAIIVLIAPKPNAAEGSDPLVDFQALQPLTARKTGRIALLKSDEAFANGPRVLTLAQKLRAEMARLFPSDRASASAPPPRAL